MDVWLIVLYAAASFLALRSLVSLMGEHRHRHLNRLVREHHESRHKARAASRTREEEPRRHGDTEKTTVGASVSGGTG